MKKAFTLIELVFVIVVVAILSVSLLPSLKKDSLREAATQVISHIRYVQHLALVDDKFNSNDDTWYRKRWELVFSTANSSLSYFIFSDSQSNGNPDFLILSLRVKKKVAIECKFRSKFNTQGFTYLGTNSSINRYKNYARSEQIDVYILLGINGEPKNPDDLYLIPLNKVESIRTKDKYYNNLNTTKKRLSTFKIEKDTLVTKIIST